MQESFVDDPVAALNDAEALVVRLARSTGYPSGDEEGLLGLLSVPHAEAVSGYREATKARQATDEDPEQLSTEELRQAFRKYAALFNEMLSESGGDSRDGDGDDRTQSSDSQEALSLEGRR
ncbi:hypothetical protein ACFQ9X_35285 [Catenulispora yoronensis]